MEHFEFLYVLHRAHVLRKFIEDAEKEGEVFHVADPFVPLKGGLQAQAQIRKIHLTDEKPVLILRLRYPAVAPDGDASADRSAHIFFDGKFTKMPIKVDNGHWIERVYFSPDVLRPVTIPADDASGPGPDGVSSPP